MKIMIWLWKKLLNSIYSLFNFGSIKQIKYYFISFLSSLFCLWGSSYIYGFSGISNFSLLIGYLTSCSYIEKDFGILLGFLFILLSFFIKLGILVDIICVIHRPCGMGQHLFWVQSCSQLYLGTPRCVFRNVASLLL